MSDSFDSFLPWQNLKSVCFCKLNWSISRACESPLLARVALLVIGAFINRGSLDARKTVRSKKVYLQQELLVSECAYCSCSQESYENSATSYAELVRV